MIIVLCDSVLWFSMLYYKNILFFKIYPFKKKQNTPTRQLLFLIMRAGFWSF